MGREQSFSYLSFRGHVRREATVFRFRDGFEKGEGKLSRKGIDVRSHVTRQLTDLAAESDWRVEKLERPWSRAGMLGARGTRIEARWQSSNSEYFIMTVVLLATLVTLFI